MNIIKHDRNKFRDFQVCLGYNGYADSCDLFILHPSVSAVNFNNLTGDYYICLKDSTKFIIDQEEIFNNYILKCYIDDDSTLEEKIIELSLNDRDNLLYRRFEEDYEKIYGI